MKRLILFINCFILVFGGLFFLNARCLEAITLSPPVIEAEIGRGEAGSLKFRVYNDTKQTKLYYLSKGDFKAKGEDGQAEFFDEGETDGSYSLAGWINLPGKQVALDPGQWADVVLTIEVPQNAEPGGHYGVIFFSDLPFWIQRNESSGVGIGTRVAALILVKVDGEVEERGAIEEFAIINKKRFYSHKPINFSVKFSNQGNVHLKPEGEIEIRNMFGKKLSELTLIETFDEQEEKIGMEKLDYLPVNFSRSNVLPQSTRKFEVVWASDLFQEESSFLANLGKEFRDFRVGRYTFEIKMRYGDSREEATYPGIAVWFFPWRLLLTIFVFFGLLFWIARWTKAKISVN
ncbi:MAG: hypothetical protein ABIJ91_04500 [Candidatus Kuenenbacteria bacterium]